MASFLVVLEEAHYGRAAERLHVTASALSKRIQRLEHQVGVPLLVRDPGGVAGPTAAGARFAGEAGALLHAARAARAAARAEAPLLTLRLGVLGRIGDWPKRRQLVELGRRLAQCSPGVRLVCRPIAYSAVTSCLIDREVDVVWGHQATAPSCLDLVPLVAFERVAVVSRSHELAHAPEVHAADLVDLPMLHNPAVPAEWMAPFVLGDVRPARDARLVGVNASFASDVYAQLARDGSVVTTTPPWLAQDVGPGLRAVRLVGLPAVSYFAARRGADRRETVRTLLGLLPQTVGGMTTR